LVGDGCVVGTAAPTLKDSVYQSWNHWHDTDEMLSVTRTELSTPATAVTPCARWHTHGRTVTFVPGPLRDTNAIVTLYGTLSFSTITKR
jgi:hypothetical protein